MSELIAMWDIDGVLADNCTLVIREFQNEGKLLNVTFEDIAEWDWNHLLAPEGITKPELYAKFAQIDVTQCAPFADTIQAMRDLAADGVTNYCVTGRPEHQYAGTLEWLEAHASPFAFHGLLHVKTGQKHTWALENNPFLTVEDNRHEAIELAKVPNNISILVWAKYNALGDRDQAEMMRNFWHLERHQVPFYAKLAAKRARFAILEPARTVN